MSRGSRNHARAQTSSGALQKMRIDMDNAAFRSTDNRGRGSITSGFGSSGAERRHHKKGEK